LGRQVDAKSSKRKRKNDPQKKREVLALAGMRGTPHDLKNLGKKLKSEGG